MDADKKRKRYQRICLQLEKLLEPHDHLISAMATTAAVLHHKFDYFFWTGFYLKSGDDLMVGPYQGSVACIRLKKNTGVCQAALQTGQSKLIPDVHAFPGHIACDSRSNSELVVPVKNKSGEIIAVLDVDSRQLNSFDEADREGLEMIVKLLARMQS